MGMKIINNQQLTGALNKPFLYDVYFLENNSPKPVIIFTHGFKGFKDWGIWDLLAKSFAAAGFCFIKFNFSHNGTTLESPLDFDDLTAFSQNNFSHELADIQSLLHAIHKEHINIPSNEIQKDHIVLMGHSRSGPTCLLATSMDKNIRQLVTLAAVDRMNYAWSPKAIKEWREKGTVYILNGRTKQEMPLDFQLYEDIVQLEQKYNDTLTRLNIPWLIVHGKKDPAIHYHAAINLHVQNQKSEIFFVEEGDHVFGGKHPYKHSELPAACQLVSNKVIRFLNQQS